MFYRAQNGHIIELWWKGGGTPKPEGLTDRSGGAPLAALGAGDPTSHVFKAEGSQHISMR